MPQLAPTISTRHSNSKVRQHKKMWAHTLVVRPGHLAIVTRTDKSSHCPHWTQAWRLWPLTPTGLMDKGIYLLQTRSNSMRRCQAWTKWMCALKTYLLILAAHACRTASGKCLCYVANNVRRLVLQDTTIRGFRHCF